MPEPNAQTQVKMLQAYVKLLEDLVGEQLAALVAASQEDRDQHFAEIRRIMGDGPAARARCEEIGALAPMYAPAPAPGGAPSIN
jgi:hypothetical protein